MLRAAVWPSDSSWRHIGPAAFGGRVDDIEAVESDPRTIFVAAAGGGIFRSRNNGTTWEAVFDKYGSSMSVGDIAIAPSDPRVVWAGMGEPNNRQSSTWGDGVYKSTDGGTTWRHMGLRETQTIGRIVIDPRDANTVFVAAVGHLFGPNEERGLYRTKDGGATWQKVLNVDANTGATDVVISPDGRTLIAATYQRRRRAYGFAGSGPGSGIWRSTDGGDTWQRVTSGLPTGDLGRIGLDLSRSNPDVVYAIVEAFAPGGGVYRSNDRGATWTRQSNVNPRPNYFSQIRVDPKNPDRVWVLGVALVRSIDGGKTFSDDSIAQYTHPDNHAMWIDPARPEHIMLGNDGGVYFTYDGGRAWEYRDNLPIAQFYDISVDDRTPYWIYGGAQDNGSWAFPSGTYSRGGMTNADVLNTGFGDGFGSAVDPRDRRFIYANSQNGRAFLSDMVTREEHFIQPVAKTGSDPYRFNWNTAMLVSPNDPSLYYMGAQKLLETTNRGQTWAEISPDLSKHLRYQEMSVGDGFSATRSLSRNDGASAYGNITTISESPKARGTIYAGTDDGNVQMTRDGGKNWTDITSRFALPGPRYVSKVMTSKHDARVAYVAFDGHWDDDMTPHVFKTPDGGATWTSMALGIPAGKPVRTLEEDPRDPNLLFAGTELGLYWSNDGGAHWSAGPGDVPALRIDRVLINPRTNDLLLGTHARGVLILEDISPLRSTSSDVVLHPLRAATLVQTYRDLPWPGGDEFVAPNSPIGTYITYTLKSDAPSRDSVRIHVLAPNGAIVAEMSGPDVRGAHRVLWDLRQRLLYVPPASDSGFYGPPRAPYVAPGTYTVKLMARGREQTQTVQVLSDARGASTRDGLRARLAINERARDLSRVYFEVQTALAAVSRELDAARGKTADALVDSVALQAATLMARARGNSIVSGIGRVFDLTAAIESSSLPPTDAQERTLQASVAELADIAAKLNELISSRMPAVRAATGLPAPSGVARVTPP
jgi:photosystem II stability/assembly factor-like uncharacterized protein